MWHQDQHGQKYILTNMLYCHLCFQPTRCLYPVEGSMMACWACRLNFGGNFGRIKHHKDKCDKHKKAKIYEITFQDLPLTEFIEGINGNI